MARARANWEGAYDMSHMSDVLGDGGEPESPPEPAEQLTDPHGPRLLAEERAKASFGVEQLAEWLQGGAGRMAAKAKAEARIEGDPIFAPERIYYESKVERYVTGLEKFAHLQAQMSDGSLDDLSKEERTYYSQFGGGAGPLGIQHAMFIPTLRNQASAEQREAWLDAAENYSIIGCYGQTEISHGSNVRGMETTATYDRDTETFVLHSGTLGATKWWPAALGRTATHAIIHARVLLPGAEDGAPVEDKGVLPFFVQLRDLDTHRNIPGVESGDIGPTMGAIDLEEGWCRFNQLRIPRIAMLARYQQVEADGTWTETPRMEKRRYGTMSECSNGRLGLRLLPRFLSETVAANSARARQHVHGRVRLARPGRHHRHPLPGRSDPIRKGAKPAGNAGAGLPGRPEAGPALARGGLCAPFHCARHA